MEIDFLVQDTYNFVRPQWKIVTDLPEAARLFAEAITSNYRLQEGEKAGDANDEAEDSASDDALGEDDAGPDPEVGQSSDEAEVRAGRKAIHLLLTPRRLLVMKMLQRSRTM